MVEKIAARYQGRPIDVKSSGLTVTAP